MATNRITLSGLRRQLIESEDTYYGRAAKYWLFSEGIKNPSEKKILDIKKSLFDRYFGFSLILGINLTENQINILYRAACGEKTADTSSELSISKTRIIQLRTKAIEKLQSENVAHAVYKLTRLGYFNPIPPQLNKTEKLESALF
ncbi:MAG: hypothetical protein WCE22_00755 [Candidatus Aquirickettsiella gammari]|jgi:DNA-binding CsgD family transcriptional regulator